MALFLFTKAMMEGRAIDVFNNGDMLRDFTYIDDIVAGLVAVIAMGVAYAYAGDTSGVGAYVGFAAAILIWGWQPFDLVFRILNNLPHIALGGFAAFAGFYLARHRGDAGQCR